MMRLHPTRIHVIILCYFLLFSFLFACTKDGDILKDNAIIESVEESDISEDEESEEEESEEATEEEPEEATEEEESVEEETDMEEGFESRITSFYPVYDVYIENGKGFNKDLMRLDTDQRISYLLFDLRAIDSIGGYITDADLQFTINSDGGDGEIVVYKGLNNDWSEENIGAANAPEADIELGRIDKEYTVGTTESIILSGSDLIPERLTLIMDHTQGNDLAIASKEHPTENIPELKVTYNAPQDAPEIESEAPGVPVTDDNDGENEAPVAKATANIIGGKAPLEVKFRGAESTDDKMITKYFWDFKDGNTSTQKNPTHTFTNGGSFEVLLRVEDQEGLKDTDVITIEVAGDTNEKPVAKVSASPKDGVAPLEVSFTGSNSTDDKEVVKYTWNFKDGNTSTEADPTHTFTEAGSYKVLLTVEDEEGLKGTKTITITVSDPSNEAPTAEANANPKSGEAPLTVNFNGSNSSDDNGIVSYQWDFDGNGSATSQKPTRTFDNPGTYNVTLTVKDAQGLEDTDTVTITVEEANNNGGGGNNGNYPPGAVLASSFGWKSGDATEAFVDAIKSNNDIIVIDKQPGEWIIQPTRFFDLKNKTIIFESGVVLRAKPGGFNGQSDVLLNLTNAENVTLEGYGATMKMNKNEYNSGEFRHAFKLDRCENITVRGFVFRDSGGDGIHIAGGFDEYSRDIRIEDVKSINNRRQGMTITSAVNVWVVNSEFLDTKGTLPEAGVDLEPDHPKHRLTNINFTNCKFAGNAGAGFQIGTGKTFGSSQPISITVKNSTLSNNGLDTNNGKPSTEISIQQGNHGDPVRGEVRFEGLTFTNSKYRLLFTRKAADAFDVIFNNCDATNIVTSGQYPPIEIEGQQSANSLGGFEFNNFYMQYNKNLPFIRVSAGGSFPVKNITGTFTIKEPFDNPPLLTGGAKPENATNVNINYTHIN